ncbi:hypothetical protein MMC07_006379 [Pseudocyphellaria aurata]|nr:hypothetical protein [Pseudocyphellaria aurata]
MSSRALRKLQKQQELLQRPEDVLEDDESEVEETPVPKAQNAFDMLVDADDTDDVEAETFHSAGSNDANVKEATKNNNGPSPSSGAKKNKARKKKKQKNKIGKDKRSDTVISETDARKRAKEDELDLQLRSLPMKPRNGSYAYSNDGEGEACRLLGIDSRQLNVLNEMKRLFGKVVLEGDSEGTGTQGPGRRRGRGPQQVDLGGALARRNSPASRGQGLAGLALRRNVFMMGKDEWPKATSGGLGMEVEEKREDGLTVYRFVHNPVYQDVQSQFEACVESMEPFRLIRMLQFNPYHISTLLQVSEIAKQQGDHSVSGDLLERALFSFGRAVHSSFTTAVAEGTARFDFRRPENREFWLSGWRYITNLGQRGTWRTAYEWAKLLLSLDPEYDPLCIAMVLDQMALRAGQATHLLKLIECPFFSRRWRARANINISTSLAEFKNKDRSRSEHQLKRAISTYPWIFARLFQELNIERIPKSIWGKSPRSKREEFDCEVYVHGSKDLWNTPDVIAFLTETAESGSTSTLPPIDGRPITLDEARHVLLSGSPLLIGLLPKEFTQMSTTSSDPLPPPDNRESYSIVPRLESHEDGFEDFDDLDDLPDLHNLQLRADETGPEEQEPRLRSIESFISRLVNWRGRGETGASQLEDPQQESLDTVATSSDAQAEEPEEPEELTPRGARLMEMLRRSMSGTATLDTARFEQMLMGVDLEPGSPSRSDVEFILPNGAILVSNDGPSDSHAEQTPEQHPAVYDDERNQRWLAGQGMIKLRDFVAAHGVDEAAWSPAEVASEGKLILEEYARNALSLAQQRTRNFILDYVLRQGTSVEVRDMVLKEIERQKGEGQ